MLTIAVTKFTHGAWIVVLLIPTLVAIFLIVHNHYEGVARQLSLDGFEPPPPVTTSVLVLVGDLHRGVVRAIGYAQSLSPPFAPPIDGFPARAASRRSGASGAWACR